jgi:ABC-type nitrate/sulfonate/bicarbonate transport system substrate-binding protein
MQKVRVSISSRSNTSVPYYVAVSKGFFRDEGMDVEIIQANPRLGVMALMNGDVSFTGTFVSTVRGILSGFPLKIVLVAFKKGVYYLIAHPSVKDIQDLKGKKLGVSSIRGSDHLVAEELLRSKGLNPALMQPVVLGDTSVRLQSVITGAVEVTTLSPPHDLMAQKAGVKVLAGPPEIGMPASGMITSERLIKENPAFVRRGVRAILRANRFIDDNRAETIKVDVRIIAATNVDLLERVREGKFREDLYYRLNVVQIKLPALCERIQDIPVLVHHFIEKICKLEDIPCKGIVRETVRRLQMHSWPGNVRELQNAVEMAVAMSGDRDTLLPGDFPLKAPSHGKVIPIRRTESAIPESGLDLENAVATLERTLMQQALEKANGNKTVAASLLGLKRTTLLAKLRNLEASGLVLSEQTA